MIVAMPFLANQGETGNRLPSLFPAEIWLTFVLS